MIATTTHAVTSARARIAQGPSPRDARWLLLDRFPSHWFVLAYTYPSGSWMTSPAAGIARGHAICVSAPSPYCITTAPVCGCWHRELRTSKGVLPNLAREVRIRPPLNGRTSAFRDNQADKLRMVPSHPAHRLREIAVVAHDDRAVVGVQPAVVQEMTCKVGLRSPCRNDHRRSERVAIAAVRSFVRIIGSPRNTAAPDISDYEKSPCFTRNCGSRRLPRPVTRCQDPLRSAPSCARA